jgi:hypothetical protein
MSNLYNPNSNAGTSTGNSVFDNPSLFETAKSPGGVKRFLSLMALSIVFLIGGWSEAQAQLATLNIDQQISCFGANDGEITITASGLSGSVPFFYAWSNGATTSSFDPGNGVTLTGLTPGSYDVTVTSSGVGAQTVVSNTIVLTEPALLTAGVVFTTVTCNGANDGTITITAAGGTPAYIYTWSGPTAVGNVASATGLLPGSYNITVTDANNCGPVVLGPINIAEPTLLTATTTLYNITCFGFGNGEVTVLAAGGNAPYIYTWNSGSITTTTGMVGPGTYGVTVTDANGCVATSSKTVIEPAVLGMTATITDATCNGSANGAATITVTGGTSPYIYLWSNTSTTSSTGSVVAGNYGVTVTDVRGCVATGSFLVDEPVAFSLASASFTTVTCFGGNDHYLERRSCTYYIYMGGRFYLKFRFTYRNDRHRWFVV